MRAWRRIGREAAAIVALVGAALLAGCGGRSSASSADDTLLSYREECDGVLDCVSVPATDLRTITGDGTHSLELFCPPAAPYFGNWDADQDANVTSRLAAASARSVTLVFAKQRADRPAIYRVFLGCSARAAAFVERLGGRSTGHRPFSDLAGSDSIDACAHDIDQCISVASSRRRLGELATKRLTLKCPPDYEWFTGVWTKQRSSDAISVTQDSLDPDDNATGAAFLITNWDPFSHHDVTVAIACSADCRYAPGGCASDCESGCHDDPGCEVDGGTDTICAGEGESQQCWTAWTEQCGNGVYWSCDTALFRVCCRTCP